MQNLEQCSICRLLLKRLKSSKNILIGHFDLYYGNRLVYLYIYNSFVEALINGLKSRIGKQG